jgi:hypothetical protein
MTTLKETAINKPLTGLELSTIIERDFRERLLPNEGSLSAHIAYGRCAYEIVLRLHTANPMMPVTEINVRSRAAGVNEIDERRDADGNVTREARPELAALEAAPLTDATNDSVGGTTLTRKITSPNAERVREGLPVPVEVRQQDGTKTVEQVVYPKQPGAGDGDVKVEDSTNEAKAAWQR